MITDADIKKLAKVFATKEDIQSIRDDVAELKDRIDTVEVNLLAEISDIHDETLITSSYRPTLEDHEHRITQLESK